MINSAANAINAGAIGQASVNYVNGLVGNTAPREIGFMDRAAGVAGGLDQLQDRLQSLLNRIDGNGESAAVKQPFPSAGMAGNLSDAEARLRTCLSLVDELHARF